MPTALARPTEVVVSLDALSTSRLLVLPEAVWMICTHAPAGSRQSGSELAPQ